MSYYTKITTAGLAAITAAMNNSSKVPITYMAFGDGNGYIPEPDENATSLVNEVYRVGVNKVEVHSKNPNWLVCEAIIPSAVGGFNIREVALYDSTGNTMLAIASYPPTYKPTVEEGAAKIQTIRIVIQVDNSGNFELIVDPDIVLATVEYVNKEKENQEKLNNTFKNRTVYFEDFISDVTGSTDVTTEMQALLDSHPGDIYAKPTSIFRTTNTLYNRKHNRTINFNNAKIINKSNSRYAIVTISPSFTGSTSAEIGRFFTERHYGEEVVNSHVKNLRYELNETTGGGSNLGVGIVYGERCYMLNMVSLSSNGNSFEIRNSLQCAVYRSVFGNVRAYLGFIFMSKNCLAIGNTFNGGIDGLILKHNRDGDPDCSHIITQNIFNDCGTNGNAIGGGVWRERDLPDEIYVPGHEYVDNCKIYNNTFTNKNVFQTIAPAIFSRNWEIYGNTYRGNNLAGAVFDFGASGNPDTNEKLIGGHDIHHNNIYDVDSIANAFINARLSLRYYKNKHFNVKSKFMLQARELIGGANLDYVEFDDNEFDENCGIYCSIAGEHGFNVTANVDRFRFTGNKGVLRALKRATSVSLTALYSQAALTEFHSNKLRLKSTTDITSITAFMLNGSKVRGLNNQEIEIDATAFPLATATVVNLLNNPVVESPHTDNTYTISGTATTKRPLVTSADVVQGVNKYIGEWSYEVLNNSGRLLKTQTIEFNSPAMPTSGSYQSGELVRNTAPVILDNKVILGWLRVTTGSTHVLNTDWVEIKQSIN